MPLNYLCEEGFSALVTNKSKKRNSMKNVDLEKPTSCIQYSRLSMADTSTYFKHCKVYHLKSAKQRLQRKNRLNFALLQ